MGGATLAPGISGVGPPIEISLPRGRLGDSPILGGDLYCGGFRGLPTKEVSLQMERGRYRISIEF